MEQIPDAPEMGAAEALFWLVLLLAVYGLPSFLAILRSHHQWMAIAALNFLLGWTALGWIAAFVWSLTATRGEPET